MKRIPSKFAVSTLLTTMHPNDRVQIIDHPNYYPGAPTTGLPSMLYRVDDLLHDYRHVRIAAAAVLNVSVNSINLCEGNDTSTVSVLSIVIDTTHEQY